MRYELWGRSRETKVYEFIDSFEDEKQKFFMLDKVDKEVYYEAMITMTNFNKMPVCIMYKEFDKEKRLSLNKKRRGIYEFI